MEPRYRNPGTQTQELSHEPRSRLVAILALLAVVCVLGGVGLTAAFDSREADAAASKSLDESQWLTVMRDVPDSVPLGSVLGEQEMGPELESILESRGINRGEFLRSSREVLSGVQWDTGVTESFSELERAVEKVPALEGVTVPQVSGLPAARPDSPASSEMRRRMATRASPSREKEN